MTTTFEVESGDMTVNENVGGVRNGALAAARAGESKQYIQALFEEDARRLVTVERMESRGVMENVVNDPGRPKSVFAVRTVSVDLRRDILWWGDKGGGFVARELYWLERSFS